MCQYFMSKKHCQNVKYDDSGKYEEGGFKTWDVAEAPHHVVETAVKASNLDHLNLGFISFLFN